MESATGLLQNMAFFMNEIIRSLNRCHEDEGRDKRGNKYHPKRRSTHNFCVGFRVSTHGICVDTAKARVIFEINKDSNKNPAIDANSRWPTRTADSAAQQDLHRRRPKRCPGFSVVKSGGGRARAVYNPAKPEEFAQNDQTAPIRPDSRLRARGLCRNEQHGELAPDARHQICDCIVTDRESAVALKAAKPPRHLNASAEEEGARRRPRSRRRFSERNRKW